MILLAKLGVGVLGTAMVASAALSSEGFIAVKVHEKKADGTHLTLVVPAAIVPATLHFVPNGDLKNAGGEIRPYLPMIDAAIPALEDCSDGVLVEVNGPGEHVLIQKAGGSVVIDVDDNGDLVHVSVPLRAAQSAIHQIAEASETM